MLLLGWAKGLRQPAALSLRLAGRISACRPLRLWQRLLRSINIVIIEVIAVFTVATTIFPSLSHNLFDCCLVFCCCVLSFSSSGGGHPTHCIICCCGCPHRRYCQHCHHCHHCCCHCQLFVVSSVAPSPATALSTIRIVSLAIVRLSMLLLLAAIPMLLAACASASCYATSCWLLSPGASSYCLLWLVVASSFCLHFSSIPPSPSLELS